MAVAEVGSTASNYSTAAVSTLDITIAPTAGNTVVVFVAYRNLANDVSSISATGGTATFAQVFRLPASSGTAVLCCWIATNVGSGITKITVNNSGTAVTLACALQYSGVDNTTPLDVTTTTATNASSTAQSSASITPATSGALVIAALASIARSLTSTPFKATTAGPTTTSGTQAGTGWASEFDLWNQGSNTITENLVVASNGYSGAGAYRCDWTMAVAAACPVASIVLRPAGGSTPAPVLKPMQSNWVALQRANLW